MNVAALINNIQCISSKHHCYVFPLSRSVFDVLFSWFREEFWLGLVSIRGGYLWVNGTALTDVTHMPLPDPVSISQCVLFSHTGISLRDCTVPLVYVCDDGAAPTQGKHKGSRKVGFSTPIKRIEKQRVHKTPNYRNDIEAIPAYDIRHRFHIVSILEECSQWYGYWGYIQWIVADKRPQNRKTCFLSPLSKHWRAS